LKSAKSDCRHPPKAENPKNQSSAGDEKQNGVKSGFYHLLKTIFSDQYNYVLMPMNNKL